MKKLVLLVFAALAFTACSNDWDTLKPQDSTNSENKILRSYVYKERDPNSPLILSMPRDRVVTTRATQLNFDDVLGRSFKVDYFPFESMRNIGEPVVDMEKLSAEYDWAEKRPLRESYSHRFSYSTFERYQTTSTTTKKIYSGFEINFGLFKIGNKNAYYKHFTKTLLENSNAVFGQLDVEINDAVYNFAVNSYRLKLIRENYLKDDFINDLYNLPPHEFFTFYGPFVITNFITGGRATAIFTGISKTMATGETRENNMNIELESSFSMEKNEDGTVSLGFGKGFTNGHVNTEIFTQLDASLTTFGGEYGLGAFTTPSSIDNMNIDLTAWANSLNKKKTHTMIDIQDSGLVPLSEFIVDANWKAQYEKYIAIGDLPSKIIIEPKLVHSYAYSRFGILVSCMSLITRFNDRIVIREDVMSHPSANQYIGTWRSEIFDQLCDTYAIKAEVEILPDFDYNTNVYNSQINIADCLVLTPESEIRIGRALEPNMRKYHDVVGEKLYLLYNQNGKKVGYSIYLGKGDYLLDTYGIRQWVNTLPDTEITDDELLNYTLIAL